MGLLKRKRTIIVSGTALVAAAFAGLIVANIYVSDGYFAALKKAKAGRVATGDLKQRFAVLSRHHSNKCSLRGVDLNKLATHGRLRGSCCRPMVFNRYVQQVRGLRAYAAVNEIPADPYDIPVSLAKRLIAYGDSIKLSRAQQAVYDHAVKLRRARTVLLPLLALVRLSGAGKGSDRARGLRRRPDCSRLESWGRLRWRVIPSASLGPHSARLAATGWTMTRLPTPEAEPLPNENTNGDSQIGLRGKVCLPL